MNNEEKSQKPLEILNPQESKSLQQISTYLALVSVPTRKPDGLFSDSKDYSTSAMMWSNLLLNLDPLQVLETFLDA